MHYGCAVPVAERRPARAALSLVQELNSGILLTEKRLDWGHPEYRGHALRARQSIAPTGAHGTASAKWGAIDNAAHDETALTYEDVAAALPEGVKAMSLSPRIYE